MDVLGPMETCFMPLTYLLIEVVGSPGGGSSGKTRSGNNTDAYSGISFRPGQNELAEAEDVYKRQALPLPNNWFILRKR